MPVIACVPQVQAHAQARLWQAVAQHAVDVISDAKAAVGAGSTRIFSNPLPLPSTVV